MPNNTKTYFYIHKLTNQLIMKKKSSDYDFTLNLANIITKDDLNMDTISQITEVHESPEFEFYRAQINTLILIKVNVDLHRSTIKNYFDDLLSDESLHSCREFLIIEKSCLNSKLDLFFEDCIRDIDKLDSVQSVNNYYGNLKNTMVLGSFSRINKIKESVDEF